MRYLFFLFWCQCVCAFATPCHLILIRHGETEALANKVYAEDSGLNKKGEEQTKAVVTALKNISIDALYSSPLRRTVQSATPLSSQRGLPIQTIDALRERGHGSVEGHPMAEFEKSPLFDRYYHPKKSEDLLVRLVPDAENFAESTYRFAKCLCDIAAQHEGKTVVVFSHFGLMKGLLMHLTNRFDQSPISYCQTLHLQCEDGAFKIMAGD
jgi:broad specificity phosphatase PhoE